MKKAYVIPFFLPFQNPKPDPEEKDRIAKRLGVFKTKVSQWFIARNVEQRMLNSEDQ